MKKDRNTTVDFDDVNSAEIFRNIGYQTIDVLAEELTKAKENIGSPVLNWQTPQEQLKFWQDDFKGDKIENPLLLFRNIIKSSINMNMRGNVGHQIAAPHPITTLTSALIAHLNNGMGVYEVGMAGNAMEKIVIDDLSRIFGLPDDASGFVTSGGSLGNLTAILTAKIKYLRENPGVKMDQLVVILSEEAHYSIDRTASVIGLKKENIFKVPVDADFRIRTDLLEDFYQLAERENKKIFCIIGCSCSTSTGSFDDLAAIADFAHKYKIWFHVDAAHGGPSVFSTKYRHLLNGIQYANSIIMDFHKMMGVPSLSTAVIFRHSWYSNLTFSQDAKYLWQDQKSEEWYNSGKRTFECTKPMSIVHIYTILRMYGYDIFKEQIELLYGLAKDFAEGLNKRSDFEVLIEPQSNIVCFRFINAKGDLNILNSKIQQEIVRDGRFYIVGTTASGHYYLRVSLMNTRTTEADLQELLGLIIEKANEIMQNEFDIFYINHS